MNAYPAELIQHHYACMLVSGLLPGQAPVASPDPSRTPGETREKERERGDESAEVGGASKDGVAATEPLPSPASPPVVTPKTPTPAQAFPQMTKDLCDIFSSRGRNMAWDPSKSQSAVFHTVLVDNNVRLPPKKTRPTPRTLSATGAEQQQSLASLQPRSPLSPLHPSSPLFPDGLIAPIWLRKHRELVPSVFVSFYCLTEQVVAVGGEAEGPSEIVVPGAELKKRDEDIIRVISERKRALSERGIKFTVVLLTSRAMLESPALESRLSYIRRSSQLDSKASLFVLTPVSRAELGEFVTSLQGALYEPALDYYREHYRRAKRKRSRYPPSSSAVSQIMTAAGELRGAPVKDVPLGKEGWLARNEYKMGTFAELTSNVTDALQHYTHAYHMLVNDLLASTMVLPPRTKRWAEAKVLSDCLSFKICKLHLYRSDGDGSWDQFRTHIKRFTELSQGWGIGEMTFEFWSWLGKQYRLMGDLLDLATRDVPGYPLSAFQIPIHQPNLPSFLLHPSHLPTPTANGHFPPSHIPHHGNLVTPNEAALSAAVIPADLCQSAGSCYYLAGVCSMERWHRFRRILAEEAGSEASKDEGAWTTLTQEKKVDHAGQAIEVFTRAHEVFKRFGMQRQSLLVASKIAIAYVEGEQYDMALRFLERISRSFSAEGWQSQAQSLLLLSLKCAEMAKNAESRGRALWSILSLRVPLSSAQREAALLALQAWIHEKPSEDAKAITIETRADDGYLAVEATFSREEIELNEQGTLFQIRISSQKGRPLPGLHFDRLLIYFFGHAEPYIVEHSEGSSDGTSSSITALKTIQLDKPDSSTMLGQADLRWWSSKGTVRAFQGMIVPDRAGLLQVEKVSLQGQGAAPFSLELQLEREEDEDLAAASFVQPRWLVEVEPVRFVQLPHRQDHDGVNVHKRLHKVQVELSHEEDAFLDESFPLRLTIVNEEKTELRCSLEAAVQSLPGELATDELWLRESSEEPSTLSRLPPVSIGLVEAKGSLTKEIMLRCRHSVRPRTVEVVLKTALPGDAEEEEEEETVKSVTISVRPLFLPSFNASWRPGREGGSILAPQRPSITVSDADDENVGGSEAGSEITIPGGFDGDGKTMSYIAGVNAGLAVLSKELIWIESVRLELHETSKHLQMADDSTTRQQTHTVAEAWTSGDRWASVYDVELLSEASTGFPVEGEDGSLRPTGHLCVQWKRSSQAGPNNPLHTALFDVPLLLPPTLLSRLVVSIPTSTTLEQPLIMLLSLVNPSRLPTEIFVSLDDREADFGVLSYKTFTVPLMAKSSRNVPIHVLSKTGSALSSSMRLLPRMRAWQRDRRGRQDEGGGSGEAQAEGKIAPAARPLIPIMNQQRSGGLPVDVQLRYSKAGGGGHHPSSHNNQINPSLMVAELRAESQRNGGVWTIFAHSQTQTNHSNKINITQQPQ